MLGFQMAFDVTGDPAFPERAAFEVARELGAPVTTHAGVWGATNDDGIRLIHENGFATPQTVYVHAATLSEDSYQRIAATGGSVSVVHRERAELRARATRPPGRCARTTSRCRCPWTPACGGAATCSPRCARTLGADRSREHLEAHAKGETITNCHLRADQVVEWATRGGAHGARPGRRGRAAWSRARRPTSC